MHSHITDMHPEITTPTNTRTLAEVFETKLVNGHKTALSRQIHESISSKKAQGIVLNSKEEYSRFVIPYLMQPVGAMENHLQPTTPT